MRELTLNEIEAVTGGQPIIIGDQPIIIGDQPIIIG